MFAAEKILERAGIVEFLALTIRFGKLMGEGKEREAQKLISDTMDKYMPETKQGTPDNVINLDLKREEIDQIVTQASRDARPR
jgi:hypothetical protein